jgi:Sulfotransferase family
MSFPEKESSSTAAVPLLHIGYHKTGSSWLQQYLFRADGHPFRRADRRQVNEIFVRPNPLDFKADSARQALGSFLSQAAEDRAVPVLSQERLSGGMETGGYDSKENAQRLAAVFPEAKVLIVIRQQISMILSSYKQYARKGGVMSLKRFIKPTRRLRSTQQFDLAHFEYHRLIAHYQNLFGFERVLVLPYELFRADANAFVERIYRFCQLEPKTVTQTGKRVNVSFSGPVLAVKLWFNRLFARGPQNPGCIIPTGENRVVTAAFGLADRLIPGFLRRWSDGRMLRLIRKVSGDRYRWSNAETAELTGLDLESFGYDMPSE